MAFLNFFRTSEPREVTSPQLEESFWKLHNVPELDDNGDLFNLSKIFHDFGIPTRKEDSRNDPLLSDSELLMNNEKEEVVVVEDNSESPLLPQIHIQTKGTKRTANTPVVKFSDGGTPSIHTSEYLMNPKSINEVAPQRFDSMDSTSSYMAMRPMDEVWFLLPVFQKQLPDIDESTLQYQIRKQNFDIRSVSFSADENFSNWRAALNFHARMTREHPQTTNLTHRMIYFGLDVWRPQSIRNERRNAVFPRPSIRDPATKSCDLEPQSLGLTKYPNKSEVLNYINKPRPPKPLPKRDLVLKGIIEETKRSIDVNMSPSILNSRYYKPLKDISKCNAPINIG